LRIEAFAISMIDFLQFCNQFTRLTDEAADELYQNVTTRTFQKDEYPVRSGEICRYIFFISKGLTKTFFYKEDKEFIMRFFSQNESFTVLESFLTQKPSHFTVMALETTTVTLLSYEKMEMLCCKHHCIETLFRKLISMASVMMMKRISEMLEANGTRRYQQFVEENNELLQRINLGDLANYLGITQQSLSRIRSKK